MLQNRRLRLEISPFVARWESGGGGGEGGEGGGGKGERGRGGDGERGRGGGGGEG